jgi:hypothetical protein
LKIRQVQTTVKRRYRAANKVLDDREVQNIDVEVENIELVSVPTHLIEHHDVVRDMIANPRVQTLCGLGARNQLGAGLRVAACEQRHLMPLGNQLLGQVRYDTLRSTIEARRAAFGKWSNLRNFHQ